MHAITDREERTDLLVQLPPDQFVDEVVVTDDVGRLLGIVAHLIEEVGTTVEVILVDVLHLCFVHRHDFLIAWRERPACLEVVPCLGNIEHAGHLEQVRQRGQRADTHGEFFELLRVHHYVIRRDRGVHGLVANLDLDGLVLLLHTADTVGELTAGMDEVATRRYRGFFRRQEVELLGLELGVLVARDFAPACTQVGIAGGLPRRSENL
ncbi:hypothetical protein D3C87_1108190 [compost metagenome]